MVPLHYAPSPSTKPEAKPQAGLKPLRPDLNVPKRQARRGAAAVEFALVGPLLVVMMMGMIVYGGWLWLAQSVQSLASESARAAVGGLDGTERNRIARDFINAEAARTAGIDPKWVVVAVETDASAIRVRVTYDVSRHPIMALSGLVPSPPSKIERSAVVRIGGY